MKIRVGGALRKFCESKLLFSGASFYSSHEKKKESKVDVEYFYILLPYIKKFNKYCGLCVKYCHFGMRNAEHNQLLRCVLYCIARPTCPFSCSLIVVNDDNCHVIVTNRRISHIRGNKICRPMREPIRSLLKKQFTYGGSVYRVYQDRLQQRSIEERQAFNYDATGKSRNTGWLKSFESKNERMCIF